MAKQRKFREAVLTDEEVASLQEMNNALSAHAQQLGERQQGLLNLLEKYGPKRFTWMLANILTEREHDEGFAPDPRFYPDLRKRLERVRRSGWPIEGGLHVSRKENVRRTYDLRITLQLRADLKEYLPAIQAYQDYFLSLGSHLGFPEYVVGRYSDPHERVSWSALVDEINEGIMDWSQGKSTVLNWFGLDDYLRSKGYTPEGLRENEDLFHAALFDEERLRRLVKYHRTGE